MGLIDKIKQAGTRGAGDKKRRRSAKESREKQPKSEHEALPGGASGEEAAKTNPQRAAELAD